MPRLVFTRKIWIAPRATLCCGAHVLASAAKNLCFCICNTRKIGIFASTFLVFLDVKYWFFAINYLVFLQNVFGFWGMQKLVFSRPHRQHTLTKTLAVFGNEIRKTVILKNVSRNLIGFAVLVRKPKNKSNIDLLHDHFLVFSQHCLFQKVQARLVFCIHCFWYFDVRKTSFLFAKKPVFTMRKNQFFRSVFVSWPRPPSLCPRADACRPGLSHSNQPPNRFDKMLAKRFL